MYVYMLYRCSFHNPPKVTNEIFAFSLVVAILFNTITYCRSFYLMKMKKTEVHRITSMLDTPEPIGREAAVTSKSFTTRIY